jgi:hypothetical protein
MPTPHKNRNQVNLQFQPVLPVALTKNWNLITRPVLQVLNSTPYINNSGNLHRVTGLGDTIFVTMLSPTDRLVGNWLLAAGPTFIFPTASSSRLGQDKWQLGPLAFLVTWAKSVWWAYFRSSGGRPAGRERIRQPAQLAIFCFILLRQGLERVKLAEHVGQLVREHGSEYVDFPRRAGPLESARLGILPVRFGVQGQYMPVHPSAFGQKWNIQVIIAPVIPKLIKGDVLE